MNFEGKKIYGKSYDAPKIAQEEYCEENGVPMFAPISGVCHRCFKNIYWNTKTEKGYTTVQARKIHITACPHCNASFIE